MRKDRHVFIKNFKVFYFLTETTEKIDLALPSIEFKKEAD